MIKQYSLDEMISFLAEEEKAYKSLAGHFANTSEERAELNLVAIKFKQIAEQVHRLKDLQD